MTLTVQEDIPTTSTEEGAAGESSSLVSQAAQAAKGAISKVRGETSTKLKATGVKKIFILALIPNVPENYGNLKIILGELGLAEISYNVASDFKLINSKHFFLFYTQF